MNTGYTVRSAATDDAEAIAEIFSPSRRLLDFLPELYTPKEDHWFIKNVILKECTVTVLIIKGEIVSFLALDGNEIRLLHTHPDHIGKGYGGVLLQDTMNRCADRLELWCFQQNTAARRFYERYGFETVEFTDGHRNEEKTPDVKYCSQ